MTRLTARQVQMLRKPGRYSDGHGLHLFVQRERDCIAPRTATADGSGPGVLAGLGRRAVLRSAGLPVRVPRVISSSTHWSRASREADGPPRRKGIGGGAVVRWFCRVPVDHGVKVEHAETIGRIERPAPAGLGPARSSSVLRRALGPHLQ